MASRPLDVPRELPPVERDTLPRIFFHGLELGGRERALQYRAGGEWKGLSCPEVERRVGQLAGILEFYGVGKGDRVAILSENRPEWAMADYAILCLGAVSVPLYPSLPAGQAGYILKDSGARVLFVSSERQLEKVREVRGELPALERIIVFDEVPGLMGATALSQVLQEAEERLAGEGLRSLRERAMAVEPGDLATLIYTSGTTGNPKGVMLTHFNIASNVAAVRAHRVIEPEPGEVALSFLPLSHAFERTVDYFYWDHGISIAYVATLEGISGALSTIRPQYMVSVPRLFEKMYATATHQEGLKLKIIRWAERVGGEVVRRREQGRWIPPHLHLAHRLADRLVFSKIRSKIGGRIRAFISGGAPLGAEIATFFEAAEIPIFEGYGLTETSPVLSANRPGKSRIGSIGTPIPGTEVKLDPETGEILARGPQVMKGYWGQEEETARVIDAEGFFHTGDIGEFDGEGYLRITDRIKNLLVTAGGKNIAPAPVEQQASASPYVSQVVMLGDRRPYPVLLVVPEFERLQGWYRSTLGEPPAERRALVADARVHAFLEQETVGRLAGLARYEMPKRIQVISEEFTLENGMLTPTLKVKRKVVEERYRAEIEALYTRGGRGEG